MIINKSGIAIRLAVESLRVMGRATQGVRLIKVRDGDAIAAVAKVMHDEDEVKLDEEGNVIVSENDTTTSDQSDVTNSDANSEEE